MKDKIKQNLNKYVIGFLIYSFTLFGILSFFINKTKVDSWINYYIIFASGISILILFFYNIKEFKWKKIIKIPLILTIITSIWIIITSFCGIHFGLETFKGIVNYLCLLFLGLVIVNIPLTDEDKNFITRSFLISFLICIIIGIIQYFTGINLIKYSNSVYPGILGRINSTFFIATILDKYIVLIEILLFYNLIKNKKITYQLLLIIAGIGISLTFSRGGQLVFVFILALLFIISLFKKIYSNCLIVFLTILFMYLIPGTALSFQSGLNYVYDKINLPSTLRIDITFIDDLYKSVDKKEETGKKPSLNNEEDIDDEIEEEVEEQIEEEEFYEEDLSWISRESYKTVGMQLIKDYPIFGIGVGNYSYLYNHQNFAKYISNKKILKDMDEIRYPHNGFVQTAAEIGYIGLSLLCLTLFSYFFCVEYKKDKLKIFSLFLLFLALLFAAYTETVFNSKQYIFIFMLLLSFLCSKSKENVNKNKHK